MKIATAPTPKPPKFLKTFGDSLKSKKRLDKPTKMVYNIRKDAGEVLDLHSKYVSGNLPYHDLDNLRKEIIHRCDTVRWLLSDSGLPLPVLAGGSLRDLFYGKTAKDYDFFFNCKDEDTAYETIDKLCLAMGSSNFLVGGEVDEYGKEDDSFEGIYGVFNYNNGGIQFIVGVWPDSPNTYERFDLSVCQVSMNMGTFDVQVSDAFLETMVTKNIKFLKPQTHYSSLRHDRIQNKLFTKNIWRDELYDFPHDFPQLRQIGDIIDVAVPELPEF